MSMNRSFFMARRLTVKTTPVVQTFSSFLMPSILYLYIFTYKASDERTIQFFYLIVIQLLLYTRRLMFIYVVNITIDYN